jgi:hypothetical protein
MHQQQCLARTAKGSSGACGHSFSSPRLGIDTRAHAHVFSSKGSCKGTDWGLPESLNIEYGVPTELCWVGMHQTRHDWSLYEVVVQRVLGMTCRYSLLARGTALYGLNLVFMD